jgi:transposase
MGTRRTFTREFKAEAVKLVTDQRLSFTEAARKLGITDGLLRKWRQTLEAEAERAFPGHGHRTPADEELHRLRAENKRLRAERDILKKATAWFATDPP